MADYTIRFETDSAQAEKDLDRVDKKVKETTGEKNIHVKVDNTSEILSTLHTIGEATKTAFSVASLMPGFMDLGDILRTVTAGLTNVATGVAALPKNPGGIISSSFDLAGKSAQALTYNIAKIGFAVFGVTQSVNILNAAYGRMFDETIGREIRLQETLLRTKTALVSVNDVYVDDKKIADPYKAIIALEKPLEETLKNIRVRSLEIAGTTSDAVVQVFGVVAQQIGQFRGTLKDAEDLAISFSGALGTIGLTDPAQATQEIRSILTGTIGPDSLLARTLGITNEQITKAKASTEGLVVYLEKRLAAFSAGQSIAARSFSGVTSNIQEIREEISRAFGAPMLAPLLTGLTEVYNRMQMVIKSSMKLSETLGGIGAAVMGGTGRAIASAPVIKDADKETSTKLFDAAQAQADRFSAYVKGQISELQGTISKLTQQLIIALAQAGQGLGALIKGFANFKFEGFKLMLNSVANITAALNSTLLPALNKILQLYGSILELPPIQYVAQYLAQWQTLEQLQVLPMVRGIYVISRAWGTVTGVLKGAFDAVGTVQKAFASASTAIQGAVASVADGLRTALSFVVRIGVAIAEMGVKIGAGAIGGLAMLVTTLTEVLAKISLKVINAARGIADRINIEIAKFLMNMITLVEQTLVRLAPRIKSILAGIAASLGNSPAMQPLVNAINQVIQGLDRIPEAAKRARSGVQAAATGMELNILKLTVASRNAANGLQQLGVKGAQGVNNLRSPLAQIIQNIRQFGITAAQALQKFDFGLALVKKGLVNLGAGISAMAKAAGGAIKGLLISLGGFYAWMLAFQVVTTLVMDLVGRYQSRQGDTRSSEKAAQALKDLQTKYKDVGESADFATKKAKEAAEAIVAARYDQVAENLAQLNEQLAEFDADATVPGINSIGEAWRGLQGAIWGVIDGVMNIGTEMDKVTVPVGRMTSGLRQLFAPLLDLIKGLNDQIDKLIGKSAGFKLDENLLSILSTGTPFQAVVQGGLATKNILGAGSSYGRSAVEEDKRKAQEELARLTQEENRKRLAEDFKLMSNQREDLSKQVKEMERKNEMELHQLRMQLRTKEIDMFQAEQTLRLAREGQRVSKLIEGERGVTRLVMERIYEYLKTKKEGENSIEVARRKMVLETLNMEKNMANFKYDTELRIAELKKVIGEYEKGLADYKVKQAEREARARAGEEAGGTPAYGPGGAAGSMSPGALRELAKKAGFTGKSAIEAAAIAMAESSGKTTAHNDNYLTGGGDNSYGLMQVNMLGSMGPDRRKKNNLASNEELFDPEKNMRAAFRIWQESGGNFSAWSTFSDNSYKKYMEQAKNGPNLAMGMAPGVSAGAYIGSTGKSTGPHAHFQGKDKEELIQQILGIILKLQSEGVRGMQLSNTMVGVDMVKDPKRLRGYIEAEIKAHGRRSRSGMYTADLAAPSGTMLPVPMEGVSDTKGDLGVAGRIKDTGVTVAHLLPKSVNTASGAAKSTVPGRAVGQRAVKGGKPVVWNGSTYVPEDGGSMPTQTAAPEPPTFPDISKMMRGHYEAVREYNQQLIETDKRLNNISAQMANIRTEDAFRAITSPLFQLPDLEGMQTALDDQKLAYEELGQVVTTVYDPAMYAVDMAYKIKEKEAVRELAAGYKAIATLKANKVKDGLTLSPEDEKRLVDELKKKLADLRVANAAALLLAKQRVEEEAKYNMRVQIGNDLIEQRFNREKAIRDLKTQTALLLTTKDQRENPYFMRQMQGETEIEEYRVGLKKKIPGLTDEAINANPEYKKFIENIRNTSKELGILETAFQKLKKKLDMIEEIKSTISGGLKNVLKTALTSPLTGGDIGSDIQTSIAQLASSLGDKLLDSVLSDVMEPFEKALEQNLRKWMGVEELKTPQEMNTSALDAGTQATIEGTAATRELTGAINAKNGIVPGPNSSPENLGKGIFEQTRTGDLWPNTNLDMNKGINPFGNQNYFETTNKFSIPQTDLASNFKSSFSLSPIVFENASSLFNNSMQSFTSSLAGATTGTDSLTQVLNSTPQAATNAASGIGGLLASVFDTIKNLLGSLFGGGKGGSGILGTIVGAIGGLFGGGGGGDAPVSLLGGKGLFTNLLGFAGGGNPPIGKGVMVGENGPELSMARGLNTIIPSGTTRALVDTLTNPIDRSAGGDGGTFESNITYDGPVLNFNSEEYVRKDDIPKIVNQTVKQSYSYQRTKLRNSPADRRAVGMR